MSSPSRTERSHKTLAALIAFGALLGGCSDIYYDRRETIALGADDHIATNRVTQMVDPWPRLVGDNATSPSTARGCRRRWNAIATARSSRR